MAQDTTLVGKIVWHDLVTQDVDKAMDFYTKLIGWEYEEFDMGPMGTYNMIKVGEQTWGGFMKPPMEGVPPHWLAYAWVDDVDKAAEKVKGLKGQIAVPPTDIPNVGRFTVAMDPQGASMAFMHGKDAPKAELAKPNPKEFCWDEHMADDPEAAKGFYGELLGYTFKKQDMGEMGEYSLGMRGEYQTVGIMQKPKEVPAPPHWLSYVFVEDLDGTTKKVGELGGKVLMGPMAVPEVGRVTTIQDTVGAVVALFGDPVEP